MNRQLETDTTPSAELRREIGLQQAENHANELYKADFYGVGLSILNLNGSVTSEEITAQIGLPPGHPSAVGACMSAFVRHHKLVVQRYEKGTRPQSHAAILARWMRKNS